MRAIYKKEMRSYFHSVAAWLFLALFLAASGIYFSVICMGYGYTNYSAYIYSSITILYIVIVPILTMRLLSEEQKQKTDQLLLTSPVKVSGIVFGKYFAVLTLLFLTVLISFGQAGLLSLYGKVNWKTVLTGGLGFFLLGSCLLAVGMFLSAMTENPVIAAALSFGATLLLILLPNISDQVPERARYTYIVCGLAAIFLGWFFWKETKSGLIGGIVTALGAVIIGAAHFMKPELFDNGLSKIIDWFSVFDRFNDFCSGVLNASSVVYYVSFSAVFVFLTVWIIEKRRWN